MIEKVNIDDRGRITIPKSVRESHNLIPGEELEVHDEGDRIVLKIIIPEQKTVTSNCKWENNAFFKAGESTFGD
ncbi:MAG: AbrB/MazE/SpoVT family DNA-binding domain-containing protein [Promethearchaeota archaeon]